MDSLRIFLLSGTIGAAMVGGLYLAAGDARADQGAGLRPEHPASPIGETVDATPGVTTDLSELEEEALFAEVPDALPEGIDPPEELAAAVDAYADEIIDPETGLRMGPLTIVRTTRVASLDPDVVGHAVNRVVSARPRRPAAEPIPRLSADPGRHVILTARGMMARNETVRGSCYAYLSEVFSRAGHEGWRTRTIVHRSGREGPYANLDLIRPGDWLYIVNHPESTPVGTHSVLFVGWEDRARGYARVIEHSGWGAGASAGQERGYDISRTYRIVRPILPR